MMAASNIIYIFHTVIIVCMFLSGIFIVSVRGTKPPMIYMSLDRFVCACLTAVNLFQTAHTPLHGQALWNPLHLLMIMSASPFLFAYIFGMVRPGSPGLRFWLSAYLPLAALATLYICFEAVFGRLPLFSVYADLRNCLNMPQIWVLFMAAVFSIAGISVNTARAIGILRQHKRNLATNFSYTEGSTLGWIWLAIAVTLLKWLLFLIKIMTEGHTASLFGLLFFTVEPVIITVLVLRQKDLYGAPAPKNGYVEEIALDNNSDDTRPEQPSKKREALKNSLLLLLEKDGIFTDPDLNSHQVSVMLSTNRTYLSQIINQDMNTTFYQLINTYRLRKSVDMLRHPLYRKMKLKTVSEICGFKSLSAFSRFFKQTYGKTPTEWMEDGDSQFYDETFHRHFSRLFR